MKKNKQKIFLLFASGMILTGIVFFQNFWVEKKVAAASGAVENLDEAVARKARMAAASWGYALLENGTTHYWQPETLNYTDVATDNEVWRFTYTPTGQNYFHDIAASQWSANGNRVMFSTSRATSVSAGGTNGHAWLVGNVDGSRLRPGIGLSRVGENWSIYTAWSPTLADVAYLTGPNAYSLYKNTIADSSISNSLLVSVDSSVSRRLQTKKSIAPDGSKLYFYDMYSGNNAFVVNLLTSSLETPTTGYSRQLGFDYYWGLAPSTWFDYHDEFVAGAVNGVDGLWKYIMPENTGGSWWRSRLTGTGTNNAPVIITDNTAPYDWGGELEPINSPNMNVTNPWCSPNVVAGTNCMEYFSHFAPDRWGHYGISSKGGNSPYGASIANLRDHKYKYTFTSVPWVQHHDWEAFSDWSVSSGSTITPVVYPNQLITTQNYVSQVQNTVASAHIRVNGTAGAPYESNARPTQSPDGTKVMYHSTFLNAADTEVQLFWTVAYYPYAPEIKSASKNGSNVKLIWDFNQGSSCSSNSQTTTRTGPTPNFVNPRTYATRGWPHETLDCAPSPREIKNFRVWSSDDNSTWTPVGTTTYNNCSGSNECGMWTEDSWSYDSTQANGTTRYYAITSLENSGLESKTLSNVWKVILDGSGNITSQTQQTTYPTDPGGKSNFFTTAPNAPTLISANHKEAPATADGQYTLRWNAPIDHDLIRYYNIYASDLGIPSAIQQSRIASIPATSDYDDDGNFSYVDWLGNTDGSTQYKITAVDFQGNESGVVDLVAPSAPSGLSVS